MKAPPTAWRQRPHDRALTKVGPGSPMGELLRRYSHPDRPRRRCRREQPRPVRVLREDLILFRDRQGQPRLVVPRCAHRGASLGYSRVEDDGLRSCWHRLEDSASGRALPRPALPDRGREAARQRTRALGSVPLKKRYGPGLRLPRPHPSENRCCCTSTYCSSSSATASSSRPTDAQPQQRPGADHYLPTGSGTLGAR